MRKEILRFRFDQLREPVFLVAVGISLLVTLNHPTTINVNNPKTNKPVVMTEKVVEKESVHYLTDKDFSRLYTLRSDIKNDTCIEISQEDAWAMMQVAVLEDNTDEISQAKIMSVILNRLKDPNFPDSIIGVISQEGQFSTRNTYKSAIPDENSHKALYLIESGQVQTDYLYFEATWVKDSWQSKHRELAEVYGGTRFYK